MAAQPAKPAGAVVAPVLLRVRPSLCLSPPALLPLLLGCWCWLHCLLVEVAGLVLLLVSLLLLLLLGRSMAAPAAWCQKSQDQPVVQHEGPYGAWYHHRHPQLLQQLALQAQMYRA
jgi:protein-S-isoprenylcysteine O-methyltransferase Ste14